MKLPKENSPSCPRSSVIQPELHNSDPVTSNVKSPQQPYERAPACPAQDIAEQQHRLYDIGMDQVVADSSGTVVYQIPRH